MIDGRRNSMYSNLISLESRKWHAFKAEHFRPAILSHDDDGALRGASHRHSVSVCEDLQSRDSASLTKWTLQFLFDHLIRAQQNRWGYGKAERLRGLAVHDHLEFCRELHLKIAGLLAAQDAIRHKWRCDESCLPGRLRRRASRRR